MTLDILVTDSQNDSFDVSLYLYELPTASVSERLLGPCVMLCVDIQFVSVERLAFVLVRAPVEQGQVGQSGMVRCRDKLASCVEDLTLVRVAKALFDNLDEVRSIDMQVELLEGQTLMNFRLCLASLCFLVLHKNSWLAQRRIRPYGRTFSAEHRPESLERPRRVHLL